MSEPFVGEIRMFAGNFAPRGWAFCDGQLLAISQNDALFSLLGGAIADGLDRRRVMLAAQLFMLLVSAALALCAWLELLSPWLLLGFTFLLGCGAALNAPAWQASVQDMVSRPQVSAAVGLNSMGFNLARSTGPAIGGAIVAFAGAAVAFAINALSYLGLIAVLWRWRPTPDVLATAIWEKDARTAGQRDGCRTALCALVAGDPGSAAAQRDLRSGCQRGASAAASGRRATG